MKKGFLLGLCSLIAAVPAISVNADVLLIEDFEDATVTYSTTVADDLTDIANNNYFGRIASDTASTSANILYTNLQGSGYYGAQDTDNAASGAIDIVELNWSVNTSAFTSLDLSWFVGEDDDLANPGNEDWDADTSFRIAVQLDGGGFNDIFAIESEENGTTPGDFTNELARVDTNFDGIGDGAEITSAMTQFSSLIADAGTVDIRVTFDHLNQGDEDIAFDSLVLNGVAIPEPGSAALIGAVLCGLGLRRRRQKR